MRRTFVVLVLASLFMSALAAPAGADSDSRPFKGSVHGTVSFAPFTPGCFNNDGFNLSSVGEATGKVSHMGKTTMSSAHCTPDMGVDEILGGEMTLVAANGDKVFIAYEGTAPFPGPGTDVIIADIDFEILDGTGRFADATGGGDMTAYIVFEGFDDLEWAASWYWKGRIGY